MSTSPQKRDAETSRAALVMIFGDMADTAWRMFVPIVGLTIAGLVIDKQLHTAPWIMVVMLVIGVVIAALLVRNQFKRVQKTKE